MATVNLSWTVEGLHDGIRVERSFTDHNGITHTDYLDTLPAGSTEFEDDFSITELTEHLEVPAEDILDLLVYTLTTFRGDKQKSTKVPVPIVDTDPEWLQDFDWPQSYGPMESVEVPILQSNYNAVIDTSSYGSSGPLVVYFADPGNTAYALHPWSGDGDQYTPDFDFTQLHDLDFVRMLNSQINNNESAPLMTDVVIGNSESPFESESYALNFYSDNENQVNSSFDPEPFDIENNLPDFYFLSAPYVSSTPSDNDSVTGMAINVYNNQTGYKTAETIPWSPSIRGVYVYAASVSIVNMPKAPE